MVSPKPQDLPKSGITLFTSNFFCFFPLSLTPFSAPFKIHLMRVESGSWREITAAGVLRLKRSLLSASDNSWANMDDLENLKTGIKKDECILVMPKSWIKSGT